MYSFWKNVSVFDFIFCDVDILTATERHNIRVAHKPMLTLRRLLTNVKDKDDPEDRPGAVYKIKCSDCQATYIGENHATKRTRKSY